MLMKIKLYFFKTFFLLIVLLSSLFSFGCTQKETHIEGFLKYVYSFEYKSNSDFFEEINSSKDFQELSILLDEKYEYMETFCTKECIDRLKSNRQPISLWQFLNDNNLDMNVNDITIKKKSDTSFDFSVNVDIRKNNEIIYSSVQKGQIILDKYKKIDNVYFQNLNNIFEIN